MAGGARPGVDGQMAGMPECHRAAVHDVAVERQVCESRAARSREVQSRFIVSAERLPIRREAS